MLDIDLAELYGGGNKTFKRTGSEKYRKISRRFHVWNHKRNWKI